MDSLASVWRLAKEKKILYSSYLYKTKKLIVFIVNPLWDEAS